MQKKLNRLKRNINTLATLGSCKPEIRQAIMKNADKDLVFSLCEIIQNVLNGSINVNSTTLEKIKCHKKCFRQLAYSNDAVSRKKALLKQKGGGWMPLLIPPIIEAVKSILNL